MIRQWWAALGGSGERLPTIEASGAGALPSAFAVTDFAATAVGVAGAAVAELLAVATGQPRAVRVDRRLASMWFGLSMRPQGWKMPPLWDPIAGDYRSCDGWIRLHTNAAHHRKVALAVLGAPEEKAAVEAAVASWEGNALENAIVERGGCAAVMRSTAAWQAHPQGAAVRNEPLVYSETFAVTAPARRRVDPARPLTGIRVLDLTRILAGPVATRFLAGYGADVLRIDPPDWDEANVAPEVTLGKRCATLDLRTRDGVAAFEALLAQADVLVHGYRPDALERLGLGAERRRSIRPDLVDVSLDAYGWTGPWRLRRGFDSLVQMSSGIADAGMRHFEKDRPFPLPVQALDQAAGYLLAACAVRGLTLRLEAASGSSWRTSLARLAHELTTFPVSQTHALAPEESTDVGDDVEHTVWGEARRLRAPLTIDGASLRWERPASPLGSAVASF